MGPVDRDQVDSTRGRHHQISDRVGAHGAEIVKVAVAIIAAAIIYFYLSYHRSEEIPTEVLRARGESSYVPVGSCLGSVAARAGDEGRG